MTDQAGCFGGIRDRRGVVGGGAGGHLPPPGPCAVDRHGRSAMTNLNRRPCPSGGRSCGQPALEASSEASTLTWRCVPGSRIKAGNLGTSEVPRRSSVSAPQSPPTHLDGLPQGDGPGWVAPPIFCHYNSVVRIGDDDCVGLGTQSRTGRTMGRTALASRLRSSCSTTPCLRRGKTHTQVSNGGEPSAWWALKS